MHTRPESPVRVGDDSMPEPDLIVARGGLRDYLGRKPTVPDTALIIEVADSSLAIDSGDVLRTYAAEGFPIYWIVNIPKRRVEVYREPTGPSDRPGYQACRHFAPGERVPVVLDGREGRRDRRRRLPAVKASCPGAEKRGTCPFGLDTGGASE